RADLRVDLRRDALKLLASPRAGDAEPEVVDAERRVALAPTRGTAAAGYVAPAAAAEHPVGSVLRAVEDVPAPLPDVADHVVEAPGIGLELSDLVDVFARVVPVPRGLVERPGTHVVRAGSARVLPLGLGRQSVAVGGG